MRPFPIIGTLVVIALLVLVARYVSDGTNTGTEGIVGTSGAFGGGKEGDEGGSIHELDTITGMNDAHELVGRRINLHVPVQQHLNDVAFWVGSPDNRVLVVLARDTRDGTTRQKGEPSSHGLDADYEGETATISGTVRSLPKAEEMFSWGLTNADRDELMQRRIYVRADTVTPHFTATTGSASP